MTGKKLSQLKPVGQVRITSFFEQEERQWHSNRASGKWADTSDDSSFARDMRLWYDSFIRFRDAVMGEDADIPTALRKWVEEHSKMKLPKNHVKNSFRCEWLSIPQIQFLQLYEDAVRFLDCCDEEDSRL